MNKLMKIKEIYADEKECPACGAGYLHAGAVDIHYLYDDDDGPAALKVPKEIHPGNNDIEEFMCCNPTIPYDLRRQRDRGVRMYFYCDTCDTYFAYTVTFTEGQIVVKMHTIDIPGVCFNIAHKEIILR